MSEAYQRIEPITGTARRRFWSREQKLRIIEESLAPGEIGQGLRPWWGPGAKPPGLSL
jgi:hypothetical protein